MKILIIGKCRLINEALTESLICRSYETKSTDNIHHFFSEFSHKPTTIFYIDNETLLSYAELKQVLHKVKEDHQLKFIGVCVNKAIAADCVRMKFQFDAMLLASSGLNDMFFAINELKRGVQYFVPELKDLTEKTQTVAQSLIHPCLLVKTLTKREKEILAQIAESKTTTNIARKLYISIATVNNHKANIMLKLQISGRNTLITTAIALKPWLETAA